MTKLNFLVSPAITEPFTAGRAASRLLFDFGVMSSLLIPENLENSILDFGAGTCWVSEFCARMGFQVTSFDIHNDLQGCIENRIKADSRINPDLMSSSQGDGHAMPFDDETFGHILCYDTFHHMHTYPSVFSEFFRVLKKGGRVIFVEPGAGHSSSPETIEFVNSQKLHDPTWIERDVVLQEMDQISRVSGFQEGIHIVPMPHPLTLKTYSLASWEKFMTGDANLRQDFNEHLSKINYWDRVIFYVDKPSAD